MIRIYNAAQHKKHRLRLFIFNLLVILKTAFDLQTLFFV